MSGATGWECLGSGVWTVTKIKCKFGPTIKKNHKKLIDFGT